MVDRNSRYYFVRRVLHERVAPTDSLPPLPPDPQHGDKYYPRPDACERWFIEVTNEILDAIETADKEKPAPPDKLGEQCCCLRGASNDISDAEFPCWDCPVHPNAVLRMYGCGCRRHGYKMR